MYNVARILVLLCLWFCFHTYFIGDLYKCLAADSPKVMDRPTKGQTDQTGHFEICSKPYISLALVSYWTVRPFSLHAALQIQPLGSHSEGQD